jgi:RNA polymerase sigma factor (sigma-70 family)
MAVEDKVVEIAEAVESLARLDERLASVVEMRFFGGFSETEIAAALGVTERTVRRDFEKARMLLAAALRS